MRVLYDRQILSASIRGCHVIVPAGSVIRRVEVHLLTVPPDLATLTGDATGEISACSLLEGDTHDASTWLFGRETILEWRPVAWQGELRIGVQFQAHVWLNMKTYTNGNQLELAVTIDSPEA